MPLYRLTCNNCHSVRHIERDRQPITLCGQCRSWNSEVLLVDSVTLSIQHRPLEQPRPLQISHGPEMDREHIFEPSAPLPPPTVLSERFPARGIHADALLPKFQDDECSICLDEKIGPKLITICRHVFHDECLGEWQRPRFASGRLDQVHQMFNTCPACRTELFPGPSRAPSPRR